MAEQLQMIWPKGALVPERQCQTPEGYRLRTFQRGDEEPYVELMRSAGFDQWNQDKLNGVLANAVPNGIHFIEHADSSSIVATAMGWHKPNAFFPDGYEMGWVAAAPAHRGRGLGRVVTAAATRTLLQHGATRIYLLTDDWRLPAIKSYLRLGYAPLYHSAEMKDRWRQVMSRLDLNSTDYAGFEFNSIPVK